MNITKRILFWGMLQCMTILIYGHAAKMEYFENGIPVGMKNWWTSLSIGRTCTQ